MMLLKGVGQSREAMLGQPLVAGTTVIWPIISLSHCWPDFTVVEIDQFVE